ncbi:MAG: ABC-F family ATP-binding cassette domain-containing protein, partial [Bdellovibrionota bacterium]
RGLRVGYLPQVPTFKPGKTVLETVLEGARDPDDWEAQAMAMEAMSRLSLSGVSEFSGETPVDKLSGGWRKRVALARELVRQPDLLLLDEPTNHLDVESIEWLEDFLEHAPFAVLTITHDRLFLQRVANRIVELDRRNAGGILSVSGDYAAYCEIKDQLISSQERRETVLKNTLRRETEWLRQGAKARTTKQQARINRHGELSSEVSELEYRNRERKARLDFQGAEKNPKKLLEAKGISKSYGKKVIFKDVNINLTPGTRIGVLGANGCGKSTLIRVLLGQEQPDTGEIKRSEHLQVSYFEQNRESLDPKLTVAKTLCPSGEFVDFRGGRVHIKSYLDRFLFSYGQSEMAVGKLSGGEQSRLLLARLMLKEANLLVLDEPTNDLDLATLNVLEEVLTDFPGAVLLVTHDRYFLDQVATQILAFNPVPTRRGPLTSFASLFQWEAWHRAELLAPDKPQAAPVAAAPAPPEKKRKLSFKEQREFDSMEATIAAAEAELARLEAESAKPENSRAATKLAELAAAMSAAQAEIDRLYKRWAELE